jgi:hypothetical protein
MQKAAISFQLSAKADACGLAQRLSYLLGLLAAESFSFQPAVGKRASSRYTLAVLPLDDKVSASTKTAGELNRIVNFSVPFPFPEARRIWQTGGG